MKKIEFFATVKVECTYDETAYYGDSEEIQPMEEIKQSAMDLLQPNFTTRNNGIELKSVEVTFHDDDNINVDNWNNSCPDMVFMKQ